MAKLMNNLSSVAINPLIGAAGVSAVPMSARVVNQVGLKANSKSSADACHGSKCIWCDWFCCGRRCFTGHALKMYPVENWTSWARRSFAKIFLCHTNLLTPLAFPQIQGKHVSQIHRHPCHYILLLQPGFRLNISVLPRPVNC